MRILSPAPGTGMAAGDIHETPSSDVIKQPVGTVDTVIIASGQFGTRRSEIPDIARAVRRMSGPNLRAGIERMPHPDHSLFSTAWMSASN